MAKDYYQILGIDPNADEKSISRAFKQAARRYHPDLNPGDSRAEAAFKEVNEAYDILGDPIKKRRYDAGRAPFSPFTVHRGGPASPKTHAPPSPPPPPPPRGERKNYGFNDLGEIFEDVFGAKTRSQSDPVHLEGNDLLIRVVLNFEEAALGVSKLLRLEESGRTKVDIPGGVNTGSYVRVPHMGETGKANNGDLILEIEVRPHEKFERRGDDVIARIDVPLLTALFGGKIEIPTLEGKKMLAIQAGLQGGDEIRLPGKGALNRKTRKRGDQINIANLRTPTRLSSKDRELLREILSRY